MIKYYYTKSYVNSEDYILIGYVDGANICTFEQLFLEENFAKIQALPCFKHIGIHTYEGQFCAEFCINPDILVMSENSFEYVDTAADSWSDQVVMILTAWLDKGPITVDTLPLCYKYAGESDALVAYKRRLSMQCSNIVVVQNIQNTSVILGFKHGDTLAGAYKILTVPKIYTMLCKLLGAECAGYYQLSAQGKPFAYAVLPKEITPPDNFMIATLNECADGVLVSMIESETGILTDGLDYTQLMASGESISLPTFVDVMGDKGASLLMNEISCSKIFIREEPEGAAIVAACIDDIWISVKDMVHLQHTYDKIQEAVGVDNPIKDYFLAGTKGPAVKLLVDQTKVPSTTKVLGEHMIPTDKSDRLFWYFEKVSTEGLVGDEISGNIASGQTEGLLFANLGVAVGDINVAMEYNRMYHQYNPEMQSTVQAKPTAEFLRSLPTYEQLCQVYKHSTEVKEDILTDDAENTTTAYFSEQANASDVLDDIVPIRSYDDLDMRIDPEDIQVKSIFRYYDCVHLREAIQATHSTVDIKLIEGNSSNNTLGVCENELTFYLAVRNLIIFGICAEEHIYTFDDLNQAIANGVSSQIVSDFLKDMAQDAYILNWTHTGHVFGTDLVADADSEESDTEVSTGVKFLGYYTVEVTSKDGATAEVIKEDSIDLYKPTQGSADRETKFNSPIDGWSRITAYVENHTLNSFAWLEVTIRLLRWGARKPDSLYVPSIDSKIPKMYLNMQSLVISDFSGNFDLCNPNVYTENGRTSSYTVGLPIAVELRDSALIEGINQRYGIDLTGKSSFPCGLTLFTTFEDSTITRDTFIDIFTAAALMSTGAMDIVGVAFDKATQRFTCNDEAISIKVNNLCGDERIQKTENYLAEEHFSMSADDGFAIDDVLKLNVSSPQAYAIYACKFLMHPRQLLSAFFEGMDTKCISVFNLINKLQLAVNWDTLDACMDLLKLSPDDKNAVQEYKTNLKLDEHLQAADIFSNILFTEYIIPMYAQLASRLSSGTSLADYLNSAYEVLRLIDEHKTKAARSTEPVKFSDVINSCEKYYRFVHPTTGAPVFYGAKPSVANQFVLWGPADGVTVNAQFTDCPFIDLYDTYVKPAEFRNIWKPALSRGATAQVKAKYEAMVKRYFITPTANTYTQAIMACVQISKELKSQ